MMKFTINSKELKTILDKASVLINKKVAVPVLRRIYFEVGVDGVVKVFSTTNLEQYAEVKTEKVYDTSAGIVGVDIDDVKVITKLNGEITVEDKVDKINLKAGKKILSIPRYANTDVFFPSMDESETKILEVKENWLLETFANLAVYTSQADANKLMHCFNFNTDKGRVEALDSSRIGMRSLKNQTIFTKTQNRFETVKINNICLPVFKKIMSKKSEENVLITQDKKYVKLVGKDFTYVIRRVEGEYFNIDYILQMEQMEENFSFTSGVKELLEVVKCNYDLLKTSEKRSPMLIHTENGKLYSYVRTERYESLDEIESKHNLPDEFTIGFNPLFLMEAFNIIDTDKPECILHSPKAPMVIKGNEYKFLVLPVKITGIDTINVSKKISEVA